MEISIETTSNDQIINLGPWLGAEYNHATNRFNKEITQGVINWGDNSNTIIFSNLEHYTDTKFRHTYAAQSNYKITITGKVGWQLRSSGTEPWSYWQIKPYIKEINIQSGKHSPIYYIGIKAFDECNQLTVIPEKLFENCGDVTNFNLCFANCTQLTVIPEKLFEKCTQAINFFGCFEYCTNLSTIPTNLFKNCTQATNFDSCFIGCSSVIGNLPQLWITHPSAKGTYCFSGCIKASNYQDAVNAGWVKKLTSSENN